MGVYKVAGGQNLLDVALHLYGTVEAVIDLMLNNPKLSFDTELKVGDTLIYSDDFVIRADVVSSLKESGIVPANGMRNVFYRRAEGVPVLVVRTLPGAESFCFDVSGDGEMMIDWGDHSDLQRIALSADQRRVAHYFDDRMKAYRVVRFYGKFNVNMLDASLLEGCDVFVISPLTVDRFVLQRPVASLDFLCLLRGTYDVRLSGQRIGDLSPIREMKELMKLDLRGADFENGVLDEYLVYLAKNNLERRNCYVLLDVAPRGEYREPERDENLNYVINTGMEAIWVITHEEAWNESGAWIFEIGDRVYSYEGV